MGLAVGTSHVEYKGVLDRNLEYNTFVVWQSLDPWPTLVHTLLSPIPPFLLLFAAFIVDGWFWSTILWSCYLSIRHSLANFFFFFRVISSRRFSCWVPCSCNWSCEAGWGGLLVGLFISSSSSFFWCHLSSFLCFFCQSSDNSRGVLPDEACWTQGTGDWRF